jgi:hypothetical protein
MYLDVFSCKPFHPKSVSKVTELFFRPERINTLFVQRQAGLPQKVIWTKDQLM